MPDLAYIIRHPIQELRISREVRRGRVKRVHATPAMPKHPTRLRMAFYYWTQDVARRIVGLTSYEDAYSDFDNDRILSEDDRGDLVAPAAREGWWEPFKPWKPRHLRAAFESRRIGQINFMEFEGGITHE